MSNCRNVLESLVLQEVRSQLKKLPPEVQKTIQCTGPSCLQPQPPTPHVRHNPKGVGAVPIEGN
jgi:hypothetical protein